MEHCSEQQTNRSIFFWNNQQESLATAGLTWSIFISPNTLCSPGLDFWGQEECLLTSFQKYLSDGNKQQRQPETVGQLHPDFAVNTEPHSSLTTTALPRHQGQQSSSSTATYAFLCPLGHDHGFTKQGRAQQHGDLRKGKYVTATEEQEEQLRRKKVNSPHGECPKRFVTRCVGGQAMQIGHP